jgi:hypothetical protein
VNHEIAIKIKERNGKRRLLSDGSLLWLEAVLLAWCFPLVRHGFGGFFLEEEDERE